MLSEMRGMFDSYDVLSDRILKECSIVISGFDIFIIIIVGVYRVLDDEM
jgi:hypothetical protein